MNKQQWMIISGLILCSLVVLMSISAARRNATLSSSGDHTQPIPVRAPAPADTPPMPIGTGNALVIFEPAPVLEPQPQPVPMTQSVDIQPSVRVDSTSAFTIMSVTLLSLAGIMSRILVAGIAYLSRQHHAQRRFVAQRTIVAKAEGALS